MYKGKLYKQIDGVPMSLCLRRTLAKFLLGCLEKLFANMNNFSPNLYLRYINDIYAAVDSGSACRQFLDILDLQHKNTKFILGQKTNCDNLPLLYVQKIE